MMTAGDAKRLACRLLADELPRRWAHTQGVAARARGLASILGDESELIEAAAFLHDIARTDRQWARPRCVWLDAKGSKERLAKFDGVNPSPASVVFGLPFDERKTRRSLANVAGTDLPQAM